jgi:hypothetical protein
MLCILLAAAAKAVNDSEAFRERQHVRAADQPVHIRRECAPRGSMQTPPTPGALVAITTAADGTVGGETALIIALHPKMAPRWAINADSDNSQSIYRGHNWFTLR